MADDYEQPPQYCTCEPPKAKPDPSHHDLAKFVNMVRWRNMKQKGMPRRKRKKAQPTRRATKFY